MSRIIGKSAALTQKRIQEYLTLEEFGKDLVKIEEGYDFIVLEQTEDSILEFADSKEYKVLTENGIAFLQTSEKVLFLEDAQCFLPKGKIIKTQEIQSKKGLLKLTTQSFERWDLYSSTDEINSSVLNIFYDIKFASTVEENLIDLLKYTAWHPIFQDVTILIEPKLFSFESLLSQ